MSLYNLKYTGWSYGHFLILKILLLWYDIESFDIDESDKVYPIKIEVKTTASKADTEFFVTKNELEVSKEYKKSYFIYRVYDAKGLYPKFYRAAGCISDNFILDPVTYMARYKYS